MNKANNFFSKFDILIVDDYADNLRILSTILVEQGYQVRKAINGKLALAAIETQKPDLILLDIQLPDINGYELCRLIKDNPQTKMIPIVIISVQEEAEDIVRAFIAGAADYIKKPFRTEEVIIRVKTQLMIHRLNTQLEKQNHLLYEKNYQLKVEIENRVQAEFALQEANAKLQKLAFLDSVTGVGNRRYFDEQLSRYWRQMARENNNLSLIICDLDYFKVYNDTFGHPEGDRCLKQVSDAIKRGVKRPFDAVFRYGGEEFVIILPQTPLEGAIQVAKNIQFEIELLQIPHPNSLTNPFVTLSFGIASQIPHLAQSQNDLISQADEALYLAKIKGRNTYVFYRV